jgi:hypothetical protein
MGETVVSGAADRLIQSGLMGTMLVIFSIVIIYLWRESKAERVWFLEQVRLVQQQRIDDQKATQTQLLDLVRQCTTALTSVTTTLEQQREATIELRGALKDLGEELRSFGDDIRNPRHPRPSAGGRGGG